jgi:hypothetical protein
MTVTEALASVEFIVGRDGKPRAAVLDMAAWEALIDWLEDAEDLGLAMDYLARRREAASPEAMGLVPWEEVEAELDALEAQEREASNAGVD